MKRKELYNLYQFHDCRYSHDIKKCEICGRYKRMQEVGDLSNINGTDY